MTEAIFGLIGVVVGGLLQGSTTWVLERRRDHQIVRGSARLTLGEVHRAWLGIHNSVEAGVWGELAGAKPVKDRWEEHEALFAAILSDRQWWTVYNAYRHFDHVADAAADNAATTPLTKEAADELDRVIALALNAAAMLHAVSMHGPKRRPIRTLWMHLWVRIRPLDDEKLIEEVERRLDPRQ